ncbi:MAG: chondroitinase-B domain-containing protein [Caldilineaceae bacterium]
MIVLRVYLRRYRLLLVVGLSAWLCLIGGEAAWAATYYISPAGNDQQNGAARESAWATFVHAWTVIQPGDTLIVLDGVYNQGIEPQVSGTPDAPIIVRADRDGQVIIDGQDQRIPVYLYRDYYIIEGIVARNGNHTVYFISGSNNILRRVSGYNANLDVNSDVFAIYDSHNNLIEDCLAAGTGRKMVMIYWGSHNTIRRCFADWRQWDGRQWCDDWPWGDNLQIYNSDDNIIENSIGYGSVAVWSLAIQANKPELSASGNQILGSIAIDAGMNHDGTVKSWPADRPGPTDCTQLRSFDWPGQRAGVALYGNGRIADNTLRDLFVYGSAGLGLTAMLDGSTYSNNQVDHVTLFRNGLDNRTHWGGIGAELRPEEMGFWASFTNSWVEGFDESGEGARLTNRYVNGQLTNQPLWPWPMEDRAQAELGLSPTNLVTGLLEQWQSSTIAVQDFLRDGRLLPAFRSICEP